MGKLKDFEPIPLPQMWVDELALLNASEDLRPLFSDLAAVIHTADVAWDRVIRRFGNKKWGEISPMDHISFHYFTHMYHFGSSVYHLAKTGFGAGTEALVRPMVEGLIDLSYLWLCCRRTDERAAWLDFQVIPRAKMQNSWTELQAFRRNHELPPLNPPTLYDEETWVLIREAVADFKARYGRDDWSQVGSLFERAKAVDKARRILPFVDMCNLYGITYRFLSETTHGSAAATRYFEFNPDGTPSVIEWGPSWRNMYITLDAALYVLNATIVAANHLLRLGMDVRAQLMASGMNPARFRAENADR